MNPSVEMKVGGGRDCLLWKCGSALILHRSAILNLNYYQLATRTTQTLQWESGEKVSAAASHGEERSGTELRCSGAGLLLVTQEFILLIDGAGFPDGCTPHDCHHETLFITHNNPTWQIASAQPLPKKTRGSTGDREKVYGNAEHVL
jgi:hypothetical protein